jgi:hypothetical protein
MKINQLGHLVLDISSDFLDQIRVMIALWFMEAFVYAYHHQSRMVVFSLVLTSLKMTCILSLIAYESNH